MEENGTIDMSKYVLRGGVSALVLCAIWGLYAQGVLNMSVESAWLPGILLVILAVSYGIAGVINSSASRVAMFVIGVIFWFEVVGLSMMLVNQLLGSIYSLVMEINKLAETIATNQPEVARPAFALTWWSWEIGLMIVLGTISVFFLVVNRKPQNAMTRKWALALVWGLYALLRGSTMGFLFLGAFLITYFATGLLRAALNSASSEAVKAANKAGNKTLVMIIIAATSVIGVFCLSVIGPWFTGILGVYATYPIPSLVFAIAGFSVWHLFAGDRARG